MAEILLYALIANRENDHDLRFIGAHDVADPSDMDELEDLVDTVRSNPFNFEEAGEQECLAFMSFPRDGARQIDLPEDRGEVKQMKSYELWIGESCGQRYQSPDSRGRV